MDEYMQSHSERMTKPTNHSLGHFYLSEEGESNNVFIINLIIIPQLTKDFLALPNTLYYTLTDRQWPVYSNYKNTIKQSIYATQHKCGDIYLMLTHTL